MQLTAKNINKQFQGEQVLTGLELVAPAHRVLSILGRSGSGKTTLLKILAGLEQPDTGTIWLDGTDITSLPPQQRGIVYLYQEPLLFPHLNVFENIAFGLRLRHSPEAELRTRVDTMLQELELPEQTHKMPHQLSGGQRQRVAFGRALVIQPRVLLLDEPFGALDTETRTSMQALLRRMATALQLTAVFVTHDLKEAMLMGDEIGMMERGQLRLYPSREAFIQDAATGVQQELRFWQSL